MKDRHAEVSEGAADTGAGGATHTMSNNLLADLQRVPDLQVETGVPMSLHTSFGIGGPADILVTPITAEALAQTLKVLHDAGEKPLVLGKGTNMLVLDGGIRGVVLKLAGGMQSVMIEDDTVTAESGARLACICRTCADNGLSGLEWAAGIPGTLGGALNMNAGANGGEIGQLTEWVTVATYCGELMTLNRDELSFGYRTSIFQTMDAVIARACLKLEHSCAADVRKKMHDVVQLRCEKQPVAMPSAGCVFKRPLNDYAGRLLEEAGAKGMQVGGAVVSPKHANFIVNVGGATAQDVLELIDLVQGRVRELFGVELHTEVCVVGEPLPRAKSGCVTTLTHATK